MLGAIAGDMIGKPYEGVPIKTVDFPLFGLGSRFSDDTVLTVAIADALLTERAYVDVVHEYGRMYPRCGFSRQFSYWLRSGSREPYGSFGNGSAMRVSPVAWRHETLDEVLDEAERSAAITHDHPEGIRGALATAAAVFLARTGASKDAIRAAITESFGYDLATSIENLRPDYVSTSPARAPFPPRSSPFAIRPTSRAPCATRFPWAATPIRWRALQAAWPRRTMAGCPGPSKSACGRCSTSVCGR